MRKLVIWVILIVLPVLLNAQDSLYDAFKEAKTYKEVMAAVEYNDWELLDRLDTNDLKRYRRFRSFWDTRVDTTGEMWPYSQAWMDLFYKDAKSMQTRTLNSLNWKHLGPFEMDATKNYIGCFKSVVVDPVNNNIVYAGAMTGGLWKTENALVTATDVDWTCMTNDFPSLGAMDIVIDPANNERLFFVGSMYQTNVSNVRFYSVGIFKSEDSGVTWDCVLELNPEDEIMLTRLEFDPTNSDNLFALASDRLYKSTNSGNSFSTTPLYIFTDAVQLWEITISSDDPDLIMVGGKCNTSASLFDLYYSDDGGATFYTRYSSGNFGTAPLYFVPVYNPSDNNFYVLYSGGIKKAAPPCTTWTNYYTGGLGVAFYVADMGITPNNDVYAGGTWTRKIINGALDGTIGPVEEIHADTRDIAFSDNQNGLPMFIATDGGICRNTTGGRNEWQSINGQNINGLSVNQFYDLDVSENEPEIMYGGTQDCGTLKRQSNGTWSHVMASDGGGTCAHLSDEDKAVGSYGAGFQNLRYTTTGGGTYWPFCTSPGNEPLLKYNTPIVKDYNNANIMLTGVWRMWKSTNGGETFAYDAIGGGSGSFLTAIDVAPTTSNAYAFSKFDNNHAQNSASLNITYNNGTSWNSIQSSSNPYYFNFDMDYIPITDIEFNADDVQQIFICLGGFNENAKIYQSSDGGATWKNLTYDMPNIPINTIEYDKINDVLYAGTDFGLYYFEMSAAYTWKVATGLPLMSVSSINITQLTGEMVLGTFGRGVWRADVVCPYNASTPQNITSNQVWTNAVKLTSDLNIQNGATLTIHNELKLPDDATITITNGSTLVIESDGTLMGACKIYSEGFVDVQPGGTLIVNGGKIKMGGEGRIIVNRNTTPLVGAFVYNEGSSIELADDDTYIEFIGDLEIGDYAIFTYTGNGFLKFSHSTNWDPRNIIAGTSSQIILNGASKNDKVIELNQRQMYVPENITNFSLTTAYVEMVHDYAELFLATCNQIEIDNVLFSPPGSTRTHHSGVVTIGQSDITIVNSDFEKGEKGVCGYLQWCTGSPLTIDNCTFTNNNIGIWINDKSVIVNNCTFTDNTSGFYSQATSFDENEINNCTFSNCPIPVRHLNSTGDLFMQGSTISYANTSAIQVQGNMTFTGLCNTVSGVAPSSAAAILAANNCVVSLGNDLALDGGSNSFSTSGYQILLSAANYLYMTDGHNKLYPNNQTRKIYGTLTMFPCSTQLIGVIPANYNKWYDNTNNLSSSNYLVWKNGCTQQYTINGLYGTYNSCGTKNLTTEEEQGSSDMLNIEMAAAEASETEASQSGDWSGAYQAYNSIISSNTLEPSNDIILTKERAWVGLNHSLKKMVFLKQISRNSEYFYSTMQSLVKMQELQVDNVSRLFYLEVEKATLHRLNGDYEIAIEILERLLPQAEPGEEAEYISRWICIINIDKGIRDGIITPSNVSTYATTCSEIGIETEKNGKTFGKNNQNQTSELSIEVKPNPVSQTSEITVVLPENTTGSFEIVNIEGKTIKTFEVYNKQHTQTINSTDLPKGVYTLKAISSNGQTKTTRMIIQ